MLELDPKPYLFKHTNNYINIFRTIKQYHNGKKGTRHFIY